MKKLCLFLCLALMLYYCYDDCFDLHAKEILSQTTSDSAYVDSDELYQYTSLTIQDYYEDYYFNTGTMGYDEDGTNIYYQNINFSYRKRGDATIIGEKVSVYNIVEKDNLITKIVPKKYFTSEYTDKVVVGKEYGFYIDTKYLKNDNISYGSYDASKKTLEVVGHSGAYLSYVYIFDVKYDVSNKEGSAVTIVPLFDACFRTIANNLYDSDMHVYNNSREYIVYPDIYANNYNFDAVKSHISNVSFDFSCDNAFSQDSSGVYIDVATYKYIQFDTIYSENTFSDIMKYVDTAATVVGGACKFAGLFYPPFKVAGTAISLGGKVLNGAGQLVYYSHANRVDQDVSFQAYNSFLQPNERISELSMNVCDLVGDTVYYKSFENSIDHILDEAGRVPYGTISAVYEYAGVGFTNTTEGNEEIFLRPTNYNIGFSFDLNIENFYNDPNDDDRCVKISGNLEFSHGNDTMTYENYDSEMLPINEWAQFVIEPEYNGEYLLRLYKDAKFSLYDYNNLNEPIITDSENYAKYKSKANVMCFNGSDAIVSLNKGNRYIMIIKKACREIYDTSKGYYAGEYKDVPVEYNFSLAPIISCNEVNDLKLDGKTMKLHCFEAEESSYYCFETSSSGKNLDTYITLFDEKMNIIKNDDDSGDYNFSKIEFFLKTGEKYYLGVRGFNNYVIDNVNVIVTKSDKNLQALKASKVNDVQINGKNEILYSFIPQETTTYNIGTFDNLDTYMKLYDADFNVIESDDDDGLNNNALISRTLYNGTKYYLGVSGYGTYVSGSTRLIVTKKINKLENITLDGTNINYYLYIPTEYGYHSLQTNSNYDTYMYLYDADLNMIASNDDSGVKLNACINCTLNANATYYIGVRGYSSSVSGSASLSATKKLLDTQAVVLNGNNIKLFSYTPMISATYYFETTGSYDTYMVLYDSNMKLITSNDDSGIGLNASISKALIADTLYFIGVRAYSSSVIGTTTLKIVRGLSTSQYVSLDGHNEQIFAFTPSITRTYYFETLGEYDTFMYLYDENMEEIASDDDGGVSLNAGLSATLTGGKKYYISIRAYDEELYETVTLQYS